jgi:8-oxo-dGTP diphosphatase
METIDKVAWILIKNRKILLVRSHGKTAYYFPGGKREGQETDTETLLREVKEELSVNILPESMQHLGTFAAQAEGKPEGVMVESKCYTATYEGELVPATEIEETVWFTEKDSVRTSPIGVLILSYLKEHNLID